MLRWDCAGDHGLAGGVVDRSGGTQNEGEGVDPADAGVAGDHDGGQQRGRDGADRGRYLHDAATTETISQHTGERGDENERDELQRRGQAQGGGVATGDVQDEPVLRDALHPSTAGGHELTREVPAVVAATEGLESGAH